MGLGNARKNTGILDQRSAVTLLITRPCSDDLGHFAHGDFAEADDTVSHAQRVTDDGECLCLISSDGPMKIEGLTARLVQAYAGLRY